MRITRRWPGGQCSCADPEKHRDRLGHWTETFYDAMRPVVTTRDPLGQMTTQQWCACGSLDKVIDPKGNATTWGRDLQGRVIRETRQDGVLCEPIDASTSVAETT